jgi:putative addiction module antidote
MPKELLERMNLKEGDLLVVRETHEGYVIERDNEQFERQMEAARKGMSKYRDALRELAK